MAQASSIECMAQASSIQVNNNSYFKLAEKIALANLGQLYIIKEKPNYKQKM